MLQNVQLNVSRDDLMAEIPSAVLKAILETIRERADYALKRLQNAEEERSMRWQCKDCRYVKHFTSSGGIGWAMSQM